ncbi:MAG: hypothetical protein E6713_04595 [Sporomusaceae bacterium]|nr:hypothetical protein [Sporomusaceae bacterium]
MYCPQCGVTISVEGNFCGKCGKDVAYLTQSDKQPKAAVPASPTEELASPVPETTATEGLVITEAEVAAAAKAAEELSGEGGDSAKKADEASEQVPEPKPPQVGALSGGSADHKKPAVVYFCNSCGTAVFAEDNYCYECGKKTQKEYYCQQAAGFTKKKKVLFGLIALTAFFGTAWLMYRFAKSWFH